MASRANDPVYWRAKAVGFRRRALAESGAAAAMLRARAEECAVVAAGLEAALTDNNALAVLPARVWMSMALRARLGPGSGPSRGLAAVGAAFVIGWVIGASGHLPWQGGRADPSVHLSSVPERAVAAASISPPRLVADSEPPLIAETMPAEAAILVRNSDAAWLPPAVDLTPAIAVASDTSASSAADASIGLPPSNLHEREQVSVRATSPPPAQEDAASKAAASTPSRARDVAGTDCRAYTASNTPAGAIPVQGFACRIPNGRWKLLPDLPTG